MKASCFALILCLVPAVHGADSDDAKNRPVSKVITLMKDMIGQLEKEAEEDQEIYDQMGCWCETGLKEKTKSIAAAEGTISNLKNAVVVLSKHHSASMLQEGTGEKTNAE